VYGSEGGMSSAVEKVGKGGPVYSCAKCKLLIRKTGENTCLLKGGRSYRPKGLVPCSCSHLADLAQCLFG